MSVLTIKLDASKKTFINNIIDEVVKEKGFSYKGDALHYIVESYSNNKIGNISGDYIAPNVRDVLEQIRCGYIGYENDVFICRETMMKKKENKILVGQPETVLKNCLACIQGKLEQEQKEKNKFLRNDMVKKVMLRQQMILDAMKNGMKVTPYQCMGKLLIGEGMICSTDSEHLACPLLDNKIVNIKEVCKERINPITKNRPCEDLLFWDIILKIDPKTFTDITDKDIEDIMKGLPIDTLLEDKNKSNDKINIDADYKVIEDKEKE